MPSGQVEINKDKSIKFKGYVTAPANGVYPEYYYFIKNTV